MYVRLHMEVKKVNFIGVKIKTIITGGRKGVGKGGGGSADNGYRNS